MTPDNDTSRDETVTRDGRGTNAVLGLLAVHNLVQNTLLNERGYVTGNLVVSGLLVGVGRASGLTWEEMGLRGGSLRDGLLVGGGASLAATAVGLVALAHPEMLDDDRAAASGDAVWRRALTRFPLGTALFEEVAFRGVLTALLRRAHPAARAEWLAAAAFSAWHVVPTGRALAGNRLGREMSPSQRLGAAVAGSAAAGVAGLALSAMRRGTGSLLAPWIAHSSFNTVSFLTASAAVRRRGSRREKPQPGEVRCSPTSPEPGVSPSSRRGRTARR
ncbi:MAG TPA: CPBP family intramembrane glutamic endopeptidase [Acidimicrobiia bacterium]|nr:CPBP family intramembrane glutamic endopeptidase [Acidimicrobiia bacterium]